MRTRVAIKHRIEQRFACPTALSTRWLRLRPAPHTRAQVLAYSLAVETEPHFINWLRDPFENHLARLDFPEPVASLDFVVEIIAELEAVNPFDFLIEPYAAEFPFAYPDQLHKELEPYLQVAEPGPRLRDWIAELHRAGLAKTGSTLERLTDLNLHVHETHALASGGIPTAIDPELILERSEGTSWDLAWLMTLSLRHLGLAARFACGYRVLLAEAAPSLDTVKLHAWTEIFLPGAGWVGLDPAAAHYTNETYFPLACTPDPVRARPIVDSDRNRPTTHGESLTLRRLEPVPETWPYTPTQWSDIEALGRWIDRDLAQLGLKPSMGVSMTLVSTRDSAAPEWTFSSLGASKRLSAESLLEGLRDRLALGGVKQVGQSQWYTGEELPRWRLGCFARADEVPLWRDSACLGEGQRHFTSSDAHAFARALADALGTSKDDLLPAYEDPLYAQWRAGAARLPAPDDADLRDPARRCALAERLSAPTGEAAGYVLPLRWDHAAGRFASGPWRLRRSRLFLSPGESPMGYRLPLGGLARDPQSEREDAMERSPFEELAPLPVDAAGPCEAGATHALQRPPRTALCVEVRTGRLHVFLPPLSHLEHYVVLISAVERAARASQVAVELEGYEPPQDSRLVRIVLEPEAGALRVTLPQVESWERLVDLLRAVYTEARRVDLAPERIADDGQRLPAGGGGRVTLGGARPADSPFLRRPRVLRGLIAYFQRHPCLSYLFSGSSIGEAGDAPRPDEGRDEALYELGVALARLSKECEPRPWYTDRVLRHLLSDPKGDLTRAEIRIDQLFSPDRAALRLGRVVVGAFETAPEERTAGLQTLLLLGLLGRFARVGDDGTLVRWGSALHDRFMLPYVLWQDLRGVVADLNDAGYPFQLDWFEPILALRFPILGRVQMGAIGLELRTAREPWTLLAEEVSGGSVCRFLDVANERMQVRLTGLTPGRYVLVCNDQPVPLQATGVHGEYVAAVRYKVWNPPATMHPTQPAVEALVFDLLDLWTGRVVGGCTYRPRPPAIWGPLGSPVSAPPPAGDPGSWPLEPPHPLPPPSLPAPHGRVGRFLPHGSGRPSFAAPALHQDAQRPYLLDLTHRRA